MELPVFLDEAIYLRRAWLVLDGHPLVTFEVWNKKPLFVWLLAGLWSLSSDPLVVSRTISVVSGLLTLMAVYIFAFRFKGPSAGVISGLIYLAVPFTLFHERLGIYDPLTVACSAAALYFAYQMFQRERASDAVLYGVAVGLGLINKEMAYFFLGYPMALLVGRLIGPDEVSFKSVSGRFLIGWGVALFILLIVIAYPLAVFGRGFFQSSHYFLTSSEIISFPLDQWALNLSRVTGSYTHYLGAALPILAVLQFIRSTILRRSLGIGLGLCWLAPALVIVIISDQYYSRYLLFTLPALALSAGLLLDSLGGWLASRFAVRRSLIAAGLTLLVLIQSAPLFFQIAVDPIKAKLWPPDRFQYVEGWPAGFGVNQMLARIEQEAAGGPLTVFVTLHDGIMKDVLLVYLKDNPNVDVRPIAWLEKKPVLSFMPAGRPIVNYEEPYLREGGMRTLDPAEIKRALLVINAPQVVTRDLLALNPGAQLLFSLHKPGKISYLALFELPLPEVKKEVEAEALIP